MSKEHEAKEWLKSTIRNAEKRNKHADTAIVETTTPERIASALIERAQCDGMISVATHVLDILEGRV
jgi:hypothetical protein